MSSNLQRTYRWKTSTERKRERSATEFHFKLSGGGWQVALRHIVGHCPEYGRYVAVQRVVGRLRGYGRSLPSHCPVTVLVLFSAQLQ